MKRKANPVSRWLMAPLRPLIRWAVNNAFDGLSTSRRAMAWQPDNGAVNALLIAHGDELRTKSRDIVRRNPWAANAVDSFVGNAIGTGIIPQSKHPDPKVRDQIHQAWLRWTDEADADGITDFYGMQSLACRESIEAGEVLARFRTRRASDGLSVPFQVQLLEAEHLPFHMNEDRPNGVKIRGGIEFSPINVRNAYHIYREHPHDILNTSGLVTTRVNAASMLHLYKPLRSGQHRGQPWFATVLGLLHDLDKYESAELMRKQMAAMMAFFIKKIDPTKGGLFGDEEDEDGTPLQGIEPGSTVYLGPNEDVHVSEPADVGGSFESFLKWFMRKFSAGLGITYEQATGDLAGVTYSSIRAGLLEFRRRVEAYQHQVMVFQFCRPVWRTWLEHAAMVGAIDARDYQRRPEAYLAVEWCPQAWPWVDPLADIEAEVLAVDNLLKSRTASIKETGRDAEEVDKEIKADQDREKSTGIERRDKQGSAATPTQDEKRKRRDAA